MKRMLVNATQQEELRVALVDGQKLFDLSIEIPSKEQKKANIYKGRISRIEPSLEACFVDYGAERHGFLPLKEISKDYFRKNDGGRGNMRDLLSEGQEVIVQVEKEERGNKGAALTTFISLAGRFLVLMPNNPRAGGVSRRIEGEDRDQMRQVMDELVIPDGMGAIVRTAGVGRAAPNCSGTSTTSRTSGTRSTRPPRTASAPYLVYRESDAVTRSLRDYLADDIGEVLVDDDATFATAQEYMTRFMPPEAQKKLKRYTDDIPLFTRFQIESQIESAYAHKVELPSGGSSSSTTPRPWCPSTSTPRAPRAARTSRPRRPTPTSKPRTRSPASCASVTSAASSSSTSSTWSRRRISATSKTACATR